MSHRANMDCMDASLKDFRKKTKPSGGATVVFGGDFRQTLPVVPRGTAAMQVAACIRMSLLWEHLKILSLETNMRVRADLLSQEYAKWVLDVGNGSNPEDITVFPPAIHVVYKHMDLISAIYGKEIKKTTICKNLSRAIVSTTRRNAIEFNKIIIDHLMPGNPLVCNSVGNVIMDSKKSGTFFPPEFLNTLDPPGMPAHRLLIKCNDYFFNYSFNVSLRLKLFQLFV